MPARLGILFHNLAANENLKRLGKSVAKKSNFFAYDYWGLLHKLLPWIKPLDDFIVLRNNLIKLPLRKEELEVGRLCGLKLDIGKLESLKS